MLLASNFIKFGLVSLIVLVGSSGFQAKHHDGEKKPTNSSSSSSSSSSSNNSSISISVSGGGGSKTSALPPIDEDFKSLLESVIDDSQLVKAIAQYMEIAPSSHKTRSVTIDLVKAVWPQISQASRQTKQTTTETTKTNETTKITNSTTTGKPAMKKRVSVPLKSIVQIVMEMAECNPTAPTSCSEMTCRFLNAKKKDKKKGKKQDRMDVDQCAPCPVPDWCPMPDVCKKCPQKPICPCGGEPSTVQPGSKNRAWLSLLPKPLLFPDWGIQRGPSRLSAFGRFATSSTSTTKRPENSSTTKKMVKSSTTKKSTKSTTTKKSMKSSTTKKSMKSTTTKKAGSTSKSPSVKPGTGSISARPASSSSTTSAATGSTSSKPKASSTTTAKSKRGSSTTKASKKKIKEMVSNSSKSHQVIEINGNKTETSSENSVVSNLEFVQLENGLKVLIKNRTVVHSITEALNALPLRSGGLEGRWADRVLREFGEDTSLLTSDKPRRSDRAATYSTLKRNSVMILRNIIGAIIRKKCTHCQERCKSEEMQMPEDELVCSESSKSPDTSSTTKAPSSSTEAPSSSTKAPASSTKVPASSSLAPSASTMTPSSPRQSKPMRWRRAATTHSPSKAASRCRPCSERYATNACPAPKGCPKYYCDCIAPDGRCLPRNPDGQCKPTEKPRSALSTSTSTSAKPTSSSSSSTSMKPAGANSTSTAPAAGSSGSTTTTAKPGTPSSTTKKAKSQAELHDPDFSPEDSSAPRAGTNSGPLDPKKFDDLDLDNQIADEERFKETPCNGSICADQMRCGAADLNDLTPKKKESGYIVNGEAQKYGEWPSYAKVDVNISSVERSLCGGVLIGKRHVLTAGHCVRRPKKNPDDIELGEKLKADQFEVVLGEHDSYAVDKFETHHKVEKICFSSQFKNPKDEGSRFDFAVLKLKEEVKFNDHVQPACLPYKPFPIGKSKCFVVGQGRVRAQDSDNLTTPRYVQKMPVGRKACGEWGFNEHDKSRWCFTKTKGPGDSCNGDSGGPILCRSKENKWHVMGLVSYGSELCDGAESMGWVAVYTRVPALLKQIHTDCLNED